MNIRLRNALTLHDTLHGFRKWRGAGNATIEENLAQQFMVIVHKIISQVSIYLRKAYNYLDRGVFMVIIRGCGLGPKLQRLL